MKDLRWLMVIGIIATGVFFSSNHFFGGNLASPERLGKEIRTEADSLYQYRLIDDPPFRYRILFPAIVKTSYSLFFDDQSSVGFYYVYKFWSWFFLVASACLLYNLLRHAAFDPAWSFVGTCIYLLSPPSLLAYTVPVHTREDTLGYCILFTGLVCILNGRTWCFLLISFLGIACRETMLLLPLLYFLYADDRNIVRKLVITGAPMVSWVLLRLWIGHQNYDPFEGFKWNIRNTDQVIAFLFITFNMFWIPIVLHVMGLKNKDSHTKRSFFYRSYIFVFLILVITTYFGGIFNEIRLLYLFSPWIIVISLNFLKDHWTDIQFFMRSWKYSVFVILSALFWILTGYFITANQHQIIGAGRFDIAYHTWIAFFIFYAYLTTIFLPPCIRVFLFNKLK
jgi:hypothetical protein